MRFLGWLVDSQANLWIDVGKLETRLLKGRLKPVQAPVYVTGLARAGTKLLLSVLGSHHRCTSFKYCDYYGAFTPYLADRVFRAAGLGKAQKSERAHDDGMLVNAYSPEALEEVIWMQFFDYLHTTDTSNVVAAATEHPEFETVCRATLQKLLLCRRAERIVCKNNYNITRIAYLGRLFADARFVLAVREPVDHIASKSCGTRGAMWRGGPNTGMRSTRGPIKTFSAMQNSRTVAQWCHLSACARKPKQKLRIFSHFATWMRSPTGFAHGGGGSTISRSTRRLSVRRSGR